MPEKQHELILKERGDLQLSGIISIDISNERQVIFKTVMGSLLIEGSQLKVLYLNPEKAEAAVSGRIDSLKYGKQESHAPKKIRGFWHSLKK